MKNLIALLCMGFVFAISLKCLNPELKKVRQLQIRDIDLSLIPDGSYNGKYSYGKFTYKVITDIKDGEITNIKVVQNRNTYHAKKAEEVINTVLTEQRVNVDAVSGATTTSKALLKAIENSLEKNK